MAHTYTSCYQVTVPPLDLTSSARASGVRLRSDCESYAQLANFALLYLPAQLRAQAAEAEQRAQGNGHAHAPGWIVSAEEDLAAHIAARNKMLAASSDLSITASVPAAAPPAAAAAAAAPSEFSSFLASDLLLNGTALTKSRHAIRREFHAIHGAGASVGGGGRGVIYGVRHQRGVHQMRKGQVDGSLEAAAAAAAAHLDRPAGQQLDGLMGGLPYWMRTEPAHASLPRSTTHAAFTAIPRESSRMDQQWFHAAFEEPAPPTPLLRSDSGHSIPPPTPGPRSLWDRSRVPRMPLLSSAQPNLFLLGSPSSAQAAKSYPAWARTSRILRSEAREDRAMQSQQRQQQQQLQPKWEEESKEQQLPVFVPCTMNGSRTERGSRSAQGSRTARPQQQHQPRPLFNPSAFAAAAEPASRPQPPSGSQSARVPSHADRASTASISAAAAVAGPTFQEHMQAARQRWAQQQQDSD